MHRSIGAAGVSPAAPCDHRCMAMRARSFSSRSALAAACLIALALSTGACGKGSPAKRASAAQGAGVPAATVAVIEGWTDALRDGHLGRAAAYWAHPSEMVNGPDESGRLTLIQIRSEHDALLADETLSCGATLHATVRSGRYVRAVFVLGLRSGAGAAKSGCSGPASVDFLIRDGHIVRWLRAPAGGGSSPPPASEPGGAAGAQSI
jgi:hypothetical protein